MTINRRLFTGACVATPAVLLGPGHAALGAEAAVEPVLGDDGLHKQPFFLDSFLELGDDLDEAHAAGKRFVVIWEQKGCPYCRELHRVNFAKKEIREFVSSQFTVLQLDLWGSREVTDFDGETLEERALARKWRVNFTPTMQFFPSSRADAPGKSGLDIEVARLPGYFKPFHFMTMFEFVRDNAYEKVNFQRYLQEKFARYEAAGKDPSVW